MEIAGIAAATALPRGALLEDDWLYFPSVPTATGATSNTSCTGACAAAPPIPISSLACATVRWDYVRAQRVCHSLVDLMMQELPALVPSGYVVTRGTKEYEVLLEWHSNELSALHIRQAKEAIARMVKDVIASKCQTSDGKRGKNIVGAIKVDVRCKCLGDPAPPHLPSETLQSLVPFVARGRSPSACCVASSDSSVCRSRNLGGSPMRGLSGHRPQELLVTAMDPPVKYGFLQWKVPFFDSDGSSSDNDSAASEPGTSSRCESLSPTHSDVHRIAQCLSAGKAHGLTSLGGSCRSSISTACGSQRASITSSAMPGSRRSSRLSLRSSRLSIQSFSSMGFGQYSSMLHLDLKEETHG